MIGGPAIRAGTEISAPEQPPGAAIEAAGVCITFGERAVLRGVDLALAGGERVALLGRNGAGKTTLVRVLAGAMRPTAGEVRVHGRSFQRAAAAARASIGVLGHQSYLYPELTTAENLVFYARLFRVARVVERVDQVLELVGLTERRHDRAATLSRGMVQRLALARAVVHDPPILLLDEPGAGLDERALTSLDAIVRGSGDSRTVLMTTHDVEHALRFAHGVAVLHGGRIVDRQPACSHDAQTLGQWYRALSAERPRPARPQFTPQPS